MKHFLTKGFDKFFMTMSKDSKPEDMFLTLELPLTDLSLAMKEGDTCRVEGVGAVFDGNWQVVKAKIVTKFEKKLKVIQHLTLKKPCQKQEEKS